MISSLRARHAAISVLTTVAALRAHRYEPPSGRRWPTACGPGPWVSWSSTARSPAPAAPPPRPGRRRPRRPGRSGRARPPSRDPPPVPVDQQPFVAFREEGLGARVGRLTVSRRDGHAMKSRGCRLMVQAKARMDSGSAPIPWIGCPAGGAYATLRSGCRNIPLVRRVPTIIRASFLRGVGFWQLSAIEYRQKDTVTSFSYSVWNDNCAPCFGASVNRSSGCKVPGSRYRDGSRTKRFSRPAPRGRQPARI
jgi:hypothetical protein